MARFATTHYHKHDVRKVDFSQEMGAIKANQSLAQAARYLKGGAAFALRMINPMIFATAS